VAGFGVGAHLRGAAVNAMLLHRLPSVGQYSRSGVAFEAQASRLGGVLPLPGNSPSVRLAQAGSAANESYNSDDLLSNDSPMATFQQVYSLLKDQFVDPLPTDTQMAHGAASALLASLDDPNSRYIESPERGVLEQQSKGIYGGSGLLFTVRKVTVGDLLERQITVIDAIPGSPAASAGIQTGDVITAVDNHWVIGYDPFEAQTKEFKKLANDEYALDKAITATETKISQGISLSKAQEQIDTASTAPLTLTIQRGDAPSRDVTFNDNTPTKINDVTSHTLSNGNGYIKIAAFTDATAADFNSALTALSSAPGLVIDLRDCPGGLIDPAIAVAHSVAPGSDFGAISLRDSHADASKASAGFGKKLEELTASNAAPGAVAGYHGNIDVLVNKGTANTAEMLAAFLHDRIGARLIGGSTFGDGLAQTYFPLSDGSAFTLTTGELQTDLGKTFNMTGLTPDVAMTPQELSGDTAVAKAESLLSLGPLKVSKS
jgi:carboxyl-terminal processing protease